MTSHPTRTFTAVPADPVLAVTSFVVTLVQLGQGNGSRLFHLIVFLGAAIGFARYALVMVPVALVSLVASLVVLRLFFGRSFLARTTSGPRHAGRRRA